MIRTVKPLDIYLLLLTLVVGFIDPAIAQQKSVATFTRVKGDIYVVRDDESARKAERNQMIFTDDVIQTSEGAWATINFFDLTRVVLRPNSEFVVDKFPQRVDGGRVALSLNSGAARITTGILSNTSADNFVLKTPQGDIYSSRSEWVVRLCDNDECLNLHDELEICRRFENHATNSQVWVSVYKGNVGAEFCDRPTPLKQGASMHFDSVGNTCNVVDYVPCFILADQHLGRDKLRRLLPILEPFIKQPETSSKPVRRPPDSRGPRPRGGPGNRPPPPRR